MLNPFDTNTGYQAGFCSALLGLWDNRKQGLWKVPYVQLEWSWAGGFLESVRLFTSCPGPKLLHTKG